MRDIKFRGIGADGIMYYGRLSQDRENSTRYYKEYSQRICWNVGAAQHNIPVSNETLGQYTGREDKNGVEIYEGDNVKLPICVSRDDPAYGAYFYEGTIKFEDAKFYVESDDNGFYDSLGESKFLWNELEVIGNTHEQEPHT